MQTIVLAAGRGTRMGPLTDGVPKPMLPVADRPLVAHTMSAAVRAGASHLVLVVGYESQRVRDHFGSEFEGVPVTYAEQSSPEGTADAVATAVEYLADEPFAVLNGDDLYDEESLAELFDSTVGVGGYRVSNPEEYGVLQLDEDGFVETVREKPSDPPTDLINAGAYVFPAETRDHLDVTASPRGEREITDVLQQVCDDHQVPVVELDRWMDVGRPWELLEATEWKLSDLDRKVQGEVHDSADLRGAVVVEEGATVDAGVVIEGPVLVRSGASVGPNAYVRDCAVVGENARVGHSAEVKNSVLMEHAYVSHLSYVGDSVLGEGVNFGAGTNVANLRHDGEPVELTVEGERVSTGRRKFGAIVGHGAKTAINTSLNAGVTLSSGARTRPGEAVLKDR